jgi:hypothetical protein
LGFHPTNQDPFVGTPACRFCLCKHDGRRRLCATFRWSGVDSTGFLGEIERSRTELSATRYPEIR